MSRVPASIGDYLLQDALSRRSMAFVGVDRKGIVTEVGGAPERFGLGGLGPGSVLGEASPLFEGLLPFSESELLPQVELAEGRFADVHVFPNGEGFYVLLLDKTASAREQGAFQQRGYELNLLLRSMGFAVLQREGPGTYRLISLAPLWFRELCGPEAALLDPGAMPFLEGFLEEAEALWAKGEGTLRSGIWYEKGQRGEWHLEAIALALEGDRSLLVIEALDDLYREKFELLQIARREKLDLEQLRKEVDKKEVLLHCILHDLRGPLSAMVGSMSLLRDKELSNERVRELLELGLQQARDQEAMIRSVLEVFAAEVEELETFEFTADRAPDVLACARRVVERFEPAFLQHGVRLLLDVEDSQPLPVVGHDGRLQRVLSNLIENALRHSPRGTEVTLSIFAEADACRLEIKDQGPGVDADQVEFIFDKFRGGRSSAGVAGLGLYFCRRTVELWGGSIQYEDAAGGGAIFHLRLPRARAVAR